MQTSKLTRLLWTILLCLITSFLSQAETEQNDEQAVFYIGFNDFPQKQLTKNQALFDDYIRLLRPVMDKYKMHLWVYDVTFGGSEALQADVITFGSAPSMKIMRSFFWPLSYRLSFLC